MNPITLKAMLKVRGLNQSDLARMAGVSRQVVSHWYRQNHSNVNIHSKNLQKIAQCLGVTIEEISRPLPILTDAKERTAHEINLLWDRAYPDLELFISALFRGQPAALARLVQVYGLYQSEKIAGKKVWDKFPQYKFKMAPAQRKAAEIIWNLHKSQN